MKKSGIFTVVVAVTAMFSAYTAMAVHADVRTATAWSHEFDLENQTTDVTLVTFPFSDPIETSFAYRLMLPERYDIDQPVRVGDYYYFYTFARQIYGYDAGAFYRYDIEDKSLRLIADYGGRQEGTAFSNLCYDYTDGTMYCTDGYMGGEWLATIDLESGLHKKTCRINVPVDMAHSNFPDRVSTIAIDYDGGMWGLTYWGHIVNINKFTGECRIVSTLDYNPDNAFMYSESNRMFFDHETGECYIHMWTYGGRDEIRRVNLETGVTERFAPYESETTTRGLYGIYLPFTVAEPSAPGQVTGLEMEAASKGENRAVLSWTNPVKTFGRGGTLEELDRIEVYRNGDLIHTLEAPVIGGKVSYEDCPDKPDYYTYRVVGYNSAGRGDRACVSGYVGMGIPQMPGEVTAVPEGDAVRLSWTMPEQGSFGSYVDYSDVVYDVTRYEGINNPVATVVAEGISETAFTDMPERIGRYFYSVVARNSSGASEAGQSDRVICGPAVRVPYDFTFNDTNLNQTWTILDGNGDGDGWMAVQNGPFTFAMTSSFNAYVGYPAMEYLISPQTLLEEGKRYKVTFSAQPGSDKIAEVLAVSFGDRPSPEAQDSVAQFDIISKQPVMLRANLPAVRETGHYHFGFVHRTAVAGYKLSLLGASISEDHEGYAAVSVTDRDGNPVKDAVVTAPGVEPAVSLGDGRYMLNYLPAGKNEVTVSAHGMFDVTESVDITEWETSELSVRLEARPCHTVSGSVVDAVGDAVADALVSVTGYDEYTCLTDGNGHFTLSGVFEADNYCISVSKNRHLSFSAMSDIDKDIDLGEILLADNTRSPRTVSVSEDSECATVSWTRPANDVALLRYDDGGGTQFVGLNGGTTSSVFGTVFRTPATLYGAQFYLGSLPGVSHWNVHLYVFDLDEDGNPTSDILYHNTYVPVTDDQWNTYELPVPVEAPRGFWLAIASDGNVCIGVDGSGDVDVYPFREGVNCFSQDYASGRFIMLEDAGVRSNFMMRAMASPYDDDDMSAKPRFIRSVEREIYSGEPLAVSRIVEATPEPEPLSAVSRVLEDRLRYNVYRFESVDSENREAWTMAAESLRDESFTDTGWSALPQGVYNYAVTAVYAADAESEPVISDIVGRDMHTSLSVDVFTDTEMNVGAGARLSMTRDDAMFRYDGVADDAGHIGLEYLWKGIYDVTVVKDGFDPWQTRLELGDEPRYTLTPTLHETRNTPVALRVVEDGAPDARTLVWNMPELIKESFETWQGHDVFVPASPGYLGWSYIDGDQAPTGGLNYVWPHQFEPLSWMTFNPDLTEPSMLADGLMPLPSDGEQFILAVSSGNIYNDDWIISPRLFFDGPFSMQFDAAGWNPEAPAEIIEVGWSETDDDYNSFRWFTPQISLEAQRWTSYTANFQPETRYVAIRYVSGNLYMVMLDNIKIGDSTHIQYDNWEYYTPSYTVPPAAASYEIFLNGERVAVTDRNFVELTDLPVGHYLAAVRGVYSSGYSDTVTTEFDVEQSGSGMIPATGQISLAGRMLTVDGESTRIDLVTPDGISIPLYGSGPYDLGFLNPGIYLVRVNAFDTTVIRRIVLR